MGIEARAASRAAVLEEMFRGLAELMFGSSPAKARVSSVIVSRGADPAELLVGLLNEVVYWCEQDNRVPAQLHIEALDGHEVRAAIAGEPFDPERHAVERQVKSVTYHQACLEERAEGWYARVYVDL